MRININKIIKTFDELNQKAQVDKFINNRFLDKNSFDLIPFTLDLGTVNSTEAGFQDPNIEINSFSSYAKILTGLSNLVAKWDNSYECFITKDGITYDKLQKRYKVGRVIKANSFSLQNGSNVIPSPIDSSFNQIEISENISIQINEQLSPEDCLKVFIIPERNKWRWLYIPAGGITEYFDKDGKFIYADIQLSSVNSIYATSGGAIEQFIQKSAPGEGYTWPKYVNGILELDETRTWDLPITSTQREYSGGAAFDTLYAYGRPTINKTLPSGEIVNVFNPNIEPSRLLLAYKLETPKISPINTKPAAETDYFIGDGEPTQHQEYENWKAQFTNNFDLQTQKKYEGILKLPIIATLESTNPVFDGSRSFILWDSNFKINYNNKTFKCETNKLTGGKDIVLNGDKTIPQLLAHNSFITNHLITLPMNAETNTTWRLQDIPLIGGYLNTLTLGIPIGWTDNNVRVQMGTIPLIIPANIVLYGNKLINNKDNSWVPFDLFKENKSNSVEDSGIAGMGSTIKVAWTDTFRKNGVVYNTIQLGQKLPDGTILYWDGDCEPVQNPDTVGYVIDQIIDKTISSTNCRTVFFSGGYEVFQTTNKTKSKFTGEIRDWTNQIQFSNWKTDNGFIKFPENIQLPKPNTDQPTLIQFNLPQNIAHGINRTNYPEAQLTNSANYWKRKTGTNIYETNRRPIEASDRIATSFEIDYSNQASDFNQLLLSFTVLYFEYFEYDFKNNQSSRIFQVDLKALKITQEYLLTVWNNQFPLEWVFRPGRPDPITKQVVIYDVWQYLYLTFDISTNGKIIATINFKNQRIDIPGPATQIVSSASLLQISISPETINNFVDKSLLFSEKKGYIVPKKVV